MLPCHNNNQLYSKLTNSSQSRGGSPKLSQSASEKQAQQVVPRNMGYNASWMGDIMVNHQPSQVSEVMVETDSNGRNGQ